MKLSIATITISKERQLSALLSSLEHIADELVVFVDNTTTDNSLAVARTFTDRAYLVEHSDTGTFEARAQEMVSACTGDWILIIADDETLSPQWNRALVSKLMADKYATHYWVPRCWMVPQNNHFICTAPWYPDYQLRFFRNIPSLLKFPTKIHESILVAGEGVYLSDASIYHWDLVWNSRENREKKVARYTRLNPENPCGEYYLYEDHYHEVASVEVIPSLPSSNRQIAPINTGLVEIKLLSHPKKMVTGQGYTVNLSISNFSTRTFCPTSHFIEKTITSIGYHWLVQDHGQIKLQQWENPLIELPIRLSPGETAQCLLPITPPHEQGNYLTHTEYDLGKWKPECLK